MTATLTEVAQRPTLMDVTLAQGHLDAGLLVTPGLAGFAGHFPDFPILPGVVQLDWAVCYAREFLLIDEPVLRVERLKFTCPIVPNTQLQLNLVYDSRKHAVDFRFYTRIDNTSEQLFSQGRLVYATDVVQS